MDDNIVEDIPWEITEDEYGTYKTRTNEHGVIEKLIVYKKKWHDENPPIEIRPQQTELEILRKENNLLKLQVEITTERADFHEAVLEEIILTITP